MGWIPDKPSDAFWFAVAPLTTAPVLVYSAAAYTTDDYPLGKADWRANARNTVLWTGIAGAVYGWNLAMSPQNAVWMSGIDAYKTMFHVAGSAMATAAAIAGIPALVYAGARESRPYVEEAHESQVQSIWEVLGWFVRTL